MIDVYSPAPEIQQNSFETEFARSFQGPIAFDFLVTTRCQMRCSVCFAPSEQMKEMSCLDWQRLIYLSCLMGTRKLVFTGGEPLLLEFLPNLLQYAKYLGQRTTLSTNAMLFSLKYRDVMPFVDEIGIPIDCPPHQNKTL